MIRGAAVALLLGLLAAACRAPEGPLVPTGPGSDGGRVTVRASSGVPTGVVEVAVLVPEPAALREALARVGRPLLRAGDGAGVRLRRAFLDDEALAALVTDPALGPIALGTPVATPMPGQIDASVVTRDPATWISLHVNLAEAEGGALFLAASAVVRPADGALLPVFRGTAPIPGGGTILLVGESGDRIQFAALLRVTIPGVDPAPPPAAPSRRRAESSVHVLTTAALSRALAACGVSEAAAAGLGVHCVSEADVERVAAALAAESGRPAVSEVVVEDGAFVEVPFGAAPVRIETLLRPEDWALDCRVHRPGAETTHAVVLEPPDALLLVGWEAGGPGRSRAAIVRFTPLSDAER